MNTKLIIDKLPFGFVEIHNKAFEGFFLTSLGSDFLNLYYNSLIKNPKGLVICLFDNNDILVGFAAGTMRSKGFHKKILMDNFFSFAWVLMNIILFRPKAIFRLFKNLNKNKTTKKDSGEYGELLSIAVPPENKGLGYGKILQEEFELKLRSFGVERIALTTDYSNNDGVLAFYEKMGYNVFYDFITYPNRRMYKLIKNLEY